MQCLFVLITAPCAVRFPTQCGRYFIATIEFASDSPDYTIQSKPMLIPGLPQNLKNHYKIETTFTYRLHSINTNPVDSVAAKIPAEGKVKEKAFQDCTEWCPEMTTSKGFEIRTATSNKAKT